MITLTQAVGPNDHALGPADAPVTLVEYGSYDCPHCKRAFQIILALLKESHDNGGPAIRFVYRHFPRETLHSQSQRAAEAAEAAGAQGRFWDLHRHLLENQQALDEASLLAYAALLGLDMKRFAREMDARTYRERIRQIFQSGVESGVHSTPTFFINGVRHDDDWDIDTLRAAIRSAATARVAA